MKQKFIRTSDSETRDVLKSKGFTEVSKSYGIYIFLNDRKMTFDTSNLKITYTNKLFV